MPLIGGYLGVVTIEGGSSLITKVAPVVETTLSPVVKIGPVDNIFRDENRVCFDMRITKLHAAVPIKYSFFVEARLSEKIPVGAYLTDTRRARLRGKAADLETHPVGESWVRHYCFELPQTVQDLDVRVSGIAVHRRHPFYDTPTPIPPFNAAA